MSAKTINRLLIVIACLAVFYSLLLFWRYQQTAPGVAVPISTSGLSRTADRLVIRGDGRTAALARRGEKWFVGKQPVGKIKISTLLQALDKLTFDRIVATKPADLETYGLNEAKSNSLKIYQGKRLLRTLYFGKMATANSFFVRADRKPTVYEARGDLVFEVGQPVSGWADRQRKLKAP